jgi:hypothetical protein
MVDKEDEDGSLYGDDPIEAVPEPLFKINKFRWTMFIISITYLIEEE